MATIDCLDQKLEFTYNPELDAYTFGLNLKKDGIWSSITRNNALVRGGSFQLLPKSVESSDDKLHISGMGRASGKQGRVNYSWKGIVSADPKSNWFKVDIELNVPEDIVLQMENGFEPEIILNMGELPPYDRGDHVWYKVNVDNPTKWNDEAYANDCPALYYYNAYSKYEIKMYFDMTAMNWMSRSNIARFLHYRCGFRRTYRPKAGYELGLYATGCSGTIFPKGRQRFVYYIMCKTRCEALTEQLAVKDLIDSCLHLVPDNSPWPKGATNWADFSQNCALDLMDDSGCWCKAVTPNYEYLIPYVNGYSPAWEEAHLAKGNVINLKKPALDAAAFIGYPLSVLNAVVHLPEYTQLLKRVSAFIDYVIDERKASIAEERKGEESAGENGTWQFTFVLEQLWQIAMLHKKETLIKYVMEEVRRYLVPLAQNCGYLFPLCFSKRTMQKTGAGDNYAVGGLYAFFMYNLYKTSGETEYLQEAKHALKVLYNVPINSLPQESFLISIGIQAACFLYEETKDPYYLQVYDYLLGQNVRMLYWFDDRTLPEFSNYNTVGLFQGCTPMFYPAFLENVECIARISSTLLLKSPHKGLLKMFNHGRKNNFYYFPQCLPEQYHTSHLKYIPLENLGVLEAERSTGSVGQEIYGCGQVFQAALLWDTYAKCSDRDIMVLYLSGYRDCLNNPASIGHFDFIVFNPENERREVEVDFPMVKTELATVWLGKGEPEFIDSLPLNKRKITIVLEPEQIVYLKIR